MSESMASDLVDPFQDQSIMSLNPRTFRYLPNVEKSKDLEAIHQQMVSMVLRSPYKVLEKAKLVIDGGSEFLNTKENNANANNKEDLQERRPALARKRAQFSLKPDISQPSTTLEPSFQIDQLQNPEDFFAAYEKFENARKEMKRQRRGEDPDEVKTSVDARRRRPEISRRKASYKHHDYSTNSESAMLSSQEILQDDIRNPPIQDSEQEFVILNDSQDEKLAGPVTKTENSLNELFDELISSDIHRLDGNEALSFLKDRLKIKPVDIDSLDLPDFHDVGRFDFVSLGENLLIKDQNRLSSTCTLPEGLIRKTPGKQKRPSTSPHHPLSSPTPPRSPLLATSTFGKLLLNSIPVIDQLPACDIDSSLITRSREITAGQLDQGSKGNEFPVSDTLGLLEKDVVMSTAGGAVSPKTSTGAAVNTSQKSPHNKMHDPLGTSLAGAMTGLEEHEQHDTTEDKDMDGYTTTSIQPSEGSSIEGIAEDIVQKAASFTQSNLTVEGFTDNVQLHIIGGIEENVEDGHQEARSSMLPEVMHEPLGTSLAGAMTGLEDHEQHDTTEDKDMDGYTTTSIQPNEGSSTEGIAEDIVQKAASFTQSNINVEGFTDNVQLHIIGGIEENVEDGHQEARSSMLPEVMHEPLGTSLAGAMTGLEDHEQHDTTEDKDMDGYTTTSIQPNEGSSTEGIAEDIVQKAASFTQSNINVEGFTDNVQLHIIGGIEENVEDGHQEARSSILPEVNTEVSKEENLKEDSSQPGTEPTEDNAVITTSQIADTDPENQHKHQPKPSINKRKKTGKRSPDLRKKRQSLADAGTSWTSGVRRSQRVRSRPLEYWKGERFLYGRVHSSLPTVIGLKYMPSAGSHNKKPDFKVESFVSNEHKELIDLVALH